MRRNGKNPDYLKGISIGFHNSMIENSRYLGASFFFPYEPLFGKMSPRLFLRRNEDRTGESGGNRAYQIGLGLWPHPINQSSEFLSSNFRAVHNMLGDFLATVRISSNFCHLEHLFAFWAISTHLSLELHQEPIKIAWKCLEMLL